jgi:hypothetical protein
MSRWIMVLWCTTVLPFATLPWVTIVREQPERWYSSHAIFHIVYLPIIAIAIVAAAQLRREGMPGAVRLLAWLLVAAEAIGFAGHAGELVAVAQHGWFDAGEDVFDKMLQEVSAAMTVPALPAGIVIVVAITVAAGLHARRERAQTETQTSHA